MSEPNDDDRLDADRFLGRYGEVSQRSWERADLVAFIAELRERYRGPPPVYVCKRCGDSIADGVMCLPCARKTAAKGAPVPQDDPAWELPEHRPVPGPTVELDLGDAAQGAPLVHVGGDPYKCLCVACLALCIDGEP